MNALSRRRQPRIRYRAPLRIKSLRTANAIEATCLDLSQGGMRVRAPALCGVGTNVVCELEVEERRLSLPGVVAWTDPPHAPNNGAEPSELQASAKTERPDTKTQIRLGTDSSEPEVGKRSGRNHTQGLYRLGEAAYSEPAPANAKAPEAAMGIRFETLSDAHAKLLSDLVRDGEPITSAVQLWFSGLAEPIRAQAHAHAAAISVRAQLPFLALDSAVRIGVAPDGEEQQGWIRSVELVTTSVERVPRLEIEIALENAAGHALASGRERTSGSHRAQASQPKGRGARAWLLLATLASGAGLGAVATWFLVARPVREAATRADPELHMPAPLFAARRANSERAPTQAAAPGALADTLAPAALTPAPTSAAMAPPIQLAAATQAEASAPSAPEPEPAQPAAEPQPPLLAAPEVTVTDRETRIFVPMDGSDTDISRYELSSPGLVVNLPHAHAQIALEDYPIYRGLVRRVWLREHRKGVQVRVVWRQSPIRSKVIFDDHGLTLRFRLGAPSREESSLHDEQPPEPPSP